MHIVDFEFDGETYTLPRLGDMPVGCFKDGSVTDRKSTRLNSSHRHTSRMPSSA